MSEDVVLAGPGAAPGRAERSLIPVIRAWVIGIVLVAVMTTPTFTGLTSVGRLDTNDGRFSIWNIAWVAHAMLSPEATIFDANIFYPHTGTLAYSELNLVAGVFGLPWYAATRHPLAALNGAVLVALVLAFVAMWALVRRLTGSDPAGLVAATAFTFCPFVSARTPHIQLLMIFVFPVALIALHRLIERPGPVRGFVLGAAVALAALACGYYGIFTGLALAFMGIALGRIGRSYVIGLGVAVLTTAAIVGPVFQAFLDARQRSGAIPPQHSLEAARGYSANLSAWLASGAWAHDWWRPALAAWQPWNEVLFPGVTLLVLAALGGWVARDRPSRRVIGAYAGLAAVALWATFGPDAGLYAWLYHAVPGMSLIRAPSRGGIVVVFALSVVAGFGVAMLARRRAWVPWVLVLVIAAESGVKTAEWGWPSWPLRRMPPLSPVYQRLATMPPGSVVQFQFPYQSANFHNHAPAMFWSSFHWKPLVNGYSDLIPADFHDIAVPINGFPDPASFAIMKARDVRYIVWQVDYYRGRPLELIEERLARYADYVRPVLRTPDVWLYEIIRWPE